MNHSGVRHGSIVAAALLLALPSSPAVLRAAPEPADDQSNPLETFIGDLNTFSAGFEQTLMNELGEEMERSVGALYVERPGKFHWAYWEPFPQLIVSDGRSLWIYDEDLEQVTIKDVTASIDDSPAALLGGDVDVDAHYVVIEVGETEGIRWLELTPRDIESQYETVRLGFRDGDLAAMELFDNLGQKTRIAFQDIRRNPSLERRLFEFTPPEGVDVVDER
jgi:outer membrane lipoprotein carrier protein